MSLVIFTTSQTPTSLRYPHPPRPNLLIPPILHTSLHASLDKKPPSVEVHNTDRGMEVVIPSRRDLLALPPQTPAVEEQKQLGDDVDEEDDGEGLDSTDAEITVRFYLVGAAAVSTEVQKQQIGRGLELFESNIRPRWRSGSTLASSVTSLASLQAAGPIDTFLIGWKGIDYVGVKTEDDPTGGCGSAKLASRREAEQERQLDEAARSKLVELWQSLPDLVPNARQLGTLSLPLSLLELLWSHPIAHDALQADARPLSAALRNHLEETSHHEDPAEAPVSDRAAHASNKDRELLDKFIDTPKRDETQAGSGGPRVNSMNTPDCHHLPQDLLDFAREHSIELWAGGGGEGSDPLPSIHLHNSLSEFASRLKSHLPASSTLGTVVGFDDAAAARDAKLGVDVNWVLQYTVISRARNIVQDKGYIISAAFT